MFICLKRSLTQQPVCNHLKMHSFTSFTSHPVFLYGIPKKIKMLMVCKRLSSRYKHLTISPLQFLKEDRLPCMYTRVLCTWCTHLLQTNKRKRSVQTYVLPHIRASKHTCMVPKTVYLNVIIGGCVGEATCPAAAAANATAVPPRSVPLTGKAQDTPRANPICCR